MAQCDNCLNEIDEETDTRVEIVKPMEFKGETEQVTRFYCTVECLLQKVGN